jgi:hypothetical protein
MKTLFVSQFRVISLQLALFVNSNIYDFIKIVPLLLVYVSAVNVQQC